MEEVRTFACTLGSRWLHDAQDPCHGVEIGHGGLQRCGRGFLLRNAVWMSSIRGGDASDKLGDCRTIDSDRDH